MKYNKIKKKFISYFIKKKHKICNSSRIINKDKTKLLFINSGINKFKDFFLGIKVPKYTKIANIQKCIRINDLKSVGIDNYHHTMFEMLGNWSIGQYDIKKAIEYAWDLIIKIYKIPKNKIYVTIFKGDKNRKIKKDLSSYNCWKKLIPKNRIFFFGFNNNFWKINDFNLCGPSTEIYVDIRKKSNANLTDVKKLIKKNNQYIIELWNIVNIKYLIKDNIITKNNKLLSNNYIDTGMGLERLSMILQNKRSTYDTDVFNYIIKKIEKVLNIKFNHNKKQDIVIKIVSDHIRTICYIMGKKILPNNNKCGYVLKKLIRRSLLYSYKILKINKPFLFKLIPLVYKKIFNDNNFKMIDFIKNRLKEEEIFYFKSIKNNIKLMLIFLKKNKIKYLDKDLIIYIYSTYGLPYFLIKKNILNKNIKIDKFKYVKNLIEL